MGRSIGVEVGGSVIGCRGSRRISLQKNTKQRQECVPQCWKDGGGIIWTFSMISQMVVNKR